MPSPHFKMCAKDLRGNNGLRQSNHIRSGVDVMQEYSDCYCEMGKNATTEGKEELSYSL
jgi:hypothetical protein